MTVEDQPSIGFICPLYTEAKAVLAIFDQLLPPATINGTKYFYGLIKDRKAVAVTLSHREFGPVEASRCANKLIREHPSLEKDSSYCFLVGIAGGIWSRDNDVRLGDVVIATRIWDWRSGKVTNEGLVSTKYPERVPAYLLRILGQFLYDRSELESTIQNRITEMQTIDRRWNYLGQDKDVLYDINYNHPGADTCDDCDPKMAQQRPRRLKTHLKVHDGLIASGNTVLKDSINRKRLQEANALAVEMEACGIPENFVVIRGISDYADTHKNDDWQPYAAAVAAACTRLMIDALDEDSYSQNTMPNLQDLRYSKPWVPHPQMSFKEYNEAVAGVAFSTDSSLLALGLDDGTVRLLNPSTGQEVHALNGHNRVANAVAFSPDNLLLASASWDHTMRLWNPTTGKEVKVLKGHSEAVTAVAFSPDGSLLASAGRDSTVRLWHTLTGQEAKTLNGHTKFVFAVAFSPDGSVLASGAYDTTIRLWNPRTGQEVQILEGHAGPVNAIAFSADSLLLASVSWDLTVRLWNPKTGHQVRTLPGGASRLFSLAVSPDGSLLAAGSTAGALRLWKPSTGQEVQTISVHTKPLRALAFSPDGSLLASASNDKTMRLWSQDCPLSHHFCNHNVKKR
ncbi:hypothetical protein H2198_005171 [Neophaeococcomyces mojaviensis]|uniref:Uncharacterized protein n=1 Tax=Neophaeococcomyces mojaviensis TaxID=3383035 RepID=A0ACC3A6D2_9EURO|nr:hypothetical protein H2198_005171 [Knufia sp. JES_112]